LFFSDNSSQLNIEIVDMTIGQEKEDINVLKKSVKGTYN